MQVNISNVVEICIAFDIAIIGIAYPIIVDKISGIGQYYNSIYIAENFKNEDIKVPLINQKINLSEVNFKYILYVTIISFLFLIFRFTPVCGLNFWLINNSASLLVIILSILFVSYFLVWLDKILLYLGFSSNLLQHLIDKYESSPDLSDQKTTALRAINDISLYAIAKQDQHLQKTLSYFYFDVFKKYRLNANKDGNYDYPEEYYNFIYNLISEILNTDKNKLQQIEHRAVSGVWLLGEFEKGVNISEKTYKWLWRNLVLISENKNFVMSFWQHSHQYMDYSIPTIRKEYSYIPTRVLNSDEVIKREEVRKRFLELHYALGGLLLYKKQYDTILECWSFTQSTPPDYPLLPQSMYDIFYWFEYFSNENYHLSDRLDYKYSFPGTFGMNSEGTVSSNICTYIVCLFLRKFTLIQYYTYQNFTSQPQFPTDLNLLRDWKTSLGYFKRLLNQLIQEKETLQKLGLYQVLENKIDEISAFIVKLENSIGEKIKSVQDSTPLSEDKVNSFLESSDQIFSEAFKQFEKIKNPETPAEIDIRLSSVVQGASTLLPKSAFVQNEIPHFNFDKIFAESIVRKAINYFVPNSFLVSKTSRYTLSLNNILESFEKIVGNNDNYIIVGVNLSYYLVEKFNNSVYQGKLFQIPSTSPGLKDVLFVLDKKYLPYFEFKNIDQEYISKMQLQPLTSNPKIFASVIDINLPQHAELKAENQSRFNSDDNALQVLATIAFTLVIHWNKNRKVIQINVSSPFNEVGVSSDINDIQPLL